MHKRCFAGIGLALALVLTADARQPPPAAIRSSAAVDKVLADAVARGDIPGVVAMVTDRSGIVYQGAFGMADADGRRPMTLDAIFRIASMTKPITSLAVMQLAEQGRLSLDDPAEKYLPRLANLQVFDTFDAKTGATRYARRKRRPQSGTCSRTPPASATTSRARSSAISSLVAGKPLPRVRSCSSRAPTGSTAPASTGRGASSNRFLARIWRCISAITSSAH